MATASTVGSGYGSGAGLLDRERIIAAAGFNRWLVPPAALAIHLCIGMAYGFSVFWLPLARAIGVEQPVVCANLTWYAALFTRTCDWRVDDLGWIYKLFFIFLGSSAALWGGWLERAGPRKAGFVSALCWCGGLVISSVGIYTHQLWLMWLGSGVIGGIGLGLGYISPVSTLIKWFPDRRGMATGMAIMGFGGGAMIGAPLADLLMRRFATSTSVGVLETFLVMGAIYFVAMMAGAFGYRLPPDGWRPEGWTPPVSAQAMITTKHVHLRDAHKTKQFWLLWLVLCLNVSAGIGVLGIASPMLQEMFGGRLIGLPEIGFTELSPAQRSAVAGIGAGLVGLLSLFNIVGRFFWASLSDRIGRKLTYAAFFGLGVVLYAGAPWGAHAGSKALFVGFFCVILSMYGGGFATIPAYLADIFGTRFVAAIHGRLLTAWSAAGLVGTSVVFYIRDAQIAAGVPRDQVYDLAMYILAGMLVLGFFCNLAVRPLAARWHMRDEQLAALQAQPAGGAPAPVGGSFGIDRGGLDLRAAIAWTAVALPITWGMWKTVEKAVALFA
jgi:MFS family permease